MKIREHKDMIELVAENERETRILRKLFGGFRGRRFRRNSFGYDRKMPKRSRDFEFWAKRQVLVFRLEVSEHETE